MTAILALAFPLCEMARAQPAAATTAHEVIDPVGRPSVSRLLKRWDFETDSHGWSAQHDCRLTVRDGVLHVTSTGDDPYLHVTGRWPSGILAVRIGYRGRTAGNGAMYWSGRGMPRGEQRVVHFPLEHDGRAHEVQARFRAEHPVEDLRLDPGTAPGDFAIDWIEVRQVELHPLAIEQLEVESDAVVCQVRNHRDEAVRCPVRGEVREFAADSRTTVRVPLEKSEPLERVSLRLVVDGFPPLERTVFVHHGHVAAPVISLPLPHGRLEVSRDGTWARIFIEGEFSGVLAPLVLRQGRAVPMRLRDEAADRLEFSDEGRETVLRLAVDGDEVTVDVSGSQEVDAPLIRPLGTLEQGLLAGVEYLGRGEWSSSTLDVRTPAHLRFEPDPWHVTLPLMAVVTDRVAVGVTWDSMPLQPLFACPNFIDGTDDHRMGLRGTSIQATLKVSKPVRLEDLILWAVRKWGLPDVPDAPRSADEQRALSLAAFHGPLRSEAGWGHCVEEKWPRRPYADIASSIWRLSGTAPELETLVPGGGHLSNDSIYFVTGRADEWLERQRRTVANILRRQEPDGAFRYRGPYAQGHFEDTASGVCAGPAVTLLQFARATGDQAALAAGLKTLDYMLRFRTPRGAQTWEIPLHTPDQLAAARLVNAYVLGYELTGRADYLDAARRWALSGVPFVYLWGQRPVMRYATPPVYGATHWKAPLWIGLPVQWVGAVYADSLTRLAAHDATLDWMQLARGILHCGEQMQYPDGEYAGLFPDAFALRDQRRLPARINPATLISLRLRVDGAPAGLAVAFDDAHHVVAPFPVTIADGQAVIEAPAGARYEVLIDGEHIRQVVSTGRDRIPLP